MKSNPVTLLVACWLQPIIRASVIEDCRMIANSGVRSPQK